MIRRIRSWWNRQPDGPYEFPLRGSISFPCPEPQTVTEPVTEIPQALLGPVPPEPEPQENEMHNDAKDGPTLDEMVPELVRDLRRMIDNYGQRGVERAVEQIKTVPPEPEPSLVDQGEQDRPDGVTNDPWDESAMAVTRLRRIAAGIRGLEANPGKKDGTYHFHGGVLPNPGGES